MNTTDPSGLCWSVAPGVAGPCPPPPDGVPYDGSFTPTEIAEFPQVLDGLNPPDVLTQLGWDPNSLPSGWSIEPASSSSLGAGAGWKLFTLSGGNIQIRWSPGSPRSDHPSTPYWTVSSGTYGPTAGNRKGSLGPAIDGGAWDQPPYATGPAGNGGNGCVTEGGGTQLASCTLDPFPLDLIGTSTSDLGGGNGCSTTEPKEIV